MGRLAKNMRERSRSCWVAAGHAVGAFLAAQQQVNVADEFVEADVARPRAEVAGGDLFEFVGLVEDDGGGFGQDAGVGCVRRPAA